MHEIIPPLTSSDYIGLFSIFMTTLVGLLAVIYGRKSYFVSLKNFETEKNMYKKAEFYIREFVNAHPERKVEPFLKKSQVRGQFYFAICKVKGGNFRMPLTTK
ncbi:hypothetical protein [Acinetobacter indicus]|uniref:Uncharacterized protein n=1 Tax=Acinetobacter indicus TaxID=756892 RepID=A0AAW8Z2S0_9GAMM|nr:hypothetical protein [Acinetobacter indicus]MDV4315420.1 hypothetical protein [Acinetobacter indicus]